MADPRDWSKRRAKFRAAVLHDTDLSPAARLVGYEIADMIHPRTGDAWPSQEWLAKRLGLGIRTVRRSIADLKASDPLTDDGWFVIELDGRSWRYIPNSKRWIDPTQKAANMAGVDTGQECSEGGQYGRSTPAKMVPLSSLSNHRKIKPRAAPCAIGDDRASGPKELTEEDKGKSSEPPSGAALAAFARKQGAPKFVFEGSEPWLAWLDYRKRRGEPSRLPITQQMIDGRARAGWYLPTLWPPGYGPTLQSA